MNRAIAAHHGKYGRACLYEQSRSMATHAHREGHLIFQLAGQTAQISLAGRAHPLSSDLGVAVNPLQPHSVSYVDSQDPALLLILYINPIWFFEISRIEEETLRFGSSYIEITPAVQWLVQAVAELLVRDGDSSLFDGYLFDLSRACYNQSHAAGVSMKRVGDKDRRVRKSISLMDEYAGDPLALDEVASRSGLSRPHFYKLFRENVGITPNVYLNTLRMERAIDRLASSEDAVTVIGLDLGFSCQASFSRFFAANVGIPPSNYRRVVQVE